MITKKQIICWGICVSLLLVLNGCSLDRQASRPVTERSGKLFPTETITNNVQKSETQTPLQATKADSVSAEVPEIVTNEQIEKQLFPRQQTQDKKQPASRIQRPIHLNQAQNRKGAKAGSIIFNFDDASLSEVIRTFAEILKLDYILEEGIEGSVTIHTAGGLHQEEVMPVFFQILEANGLTAVMDGGLYRIMKVQDAAKQPINIHLGSDLSEVAPGERVIIQIISLDHINVQEMVKIIQPFVSTEGIIITHADSNTMLLVDKGIVILKALNLVKVFDVDTFNQKNHQIFYIKNSDAEEAVDLLKSLLNAYGKSEDKITLTPIKRLNAVIAVSAESNALDWIQKMIDQIDVPGYDDSPKIYIYMVQNGTCSELSSILTGIFPGRGEDKKVESTIGQEKKKESENQVVERLLKGGTAPKSLGSIKTTELSGEDKGGQEEVGKTVGQVEVFSRSDSGADTLKGDIRITADEVRNALIIEAYPSDYQVVKRILEQLDILPRQVLIEVTIADITLTDKSDLGIEWSKFVSSGGIGGGKTSGTIGEAGINFTIGLSDDWQALLSFLASENRVNILSTPVILASDNKEASIDVADEIPVVSTSYTTVTDGNNVVTNTVQYRKTGIILSVTPHINDQGYVTMEINQEVSSTGDGVDAGGTTYPSFRTRNVETTFTVNHQQTIMIGGLMTQTDSDDSAGVPILNKIPGLNWIFGKKSDSFNKTELTIFITPHVIYSMGDVADITQEFRSRVNKSSLELKKKDRSN